MEDFCLYKGVSAQICWVIGDGHIVNFFHDTWLSDLSLSRMPIFISPEAKKSIWISDLIQPDGVVDDLTWWCKCSGQS